MLRYLRITFREAEEQADAAYAVALLGSGGKWHGGRRRTEQRDELPPPHSITSFARSRTEVGIVTPSARAVLRLTIIWNLVACSTGRSEGLAPLIILST